MTKTNLLIIIIAFGLLSISNAVQNSNHTVDECLLGNSINITTSLQESNDAFAIRIPPDRIKDYVYEISYNHSVMLVDSLTRSCVCERQQCIKLCSYDIPELYYEMAENNRSSEDMEIFNIYLTLSNGTIVRRHIIHDFQAVVYNSFCAINYHLSPEVNSKYSWALFENETLLRHHDETYLTGNEYCFDVHDDEFSMELRINPFNCATENTLTTFVVANNTTMAISIPFFLLTILAYCLIRELRNIHGKCFISYLSSLTLSYSLLSFINLSRMKLPIVPCILMGFFNHYFQLAHYTWLGIISYDNWRSCRYLLGHNSYVGYAWFGWLMPFLWTILTLVAQVSDLPDALKPGITSQHCGLDVNKWSASIYLYGPCLVVLLFCLYTFILSSKIIKRNSTDASKHLAGHRKHKLRYTLYLRLFIVMGLSWFMDVISYLCSMFELSTPSYIMDFINAFQGLYIFVNFIARRSIRSIIKETFCGGSNDDHSTNSPSHKTSNKGDSSSQLYRNRSISWD